MRELLRQIRCLQLLAREIREAQNAGNLKRWYQLSTVLILAKHGFANSDFFDNHRLIRIANSAVDNA